MMWSCMIYGGKTMWGLMSPWHTTFKWKYWGASVWARHIGYVTYLSGSPKESMYELGTLDLGDH